VDSPWSWPARNDAAATRRERSPDGLRATTTVWTRVEVSTDATGPFAQFGDVQQWLVEKVVEKLALDPALGLGD
jgi:hypothetical protein